MSPDLTFLAWCGLAEVAVGDTTGHRCAEVDLHAHPISNVLNPANSNYVIGAQAVSRETLVWGTGKWVCDVPLAISTAVTKNGPDTPCHVYSVRMHSLWGGMRLCVHGNAAELRASYMTILSIYILIHSDTFEKHSDMYHLHSPNLSMNTIH